MKLPTYLRRLLGSTLLAAGSLFATSAGAQSTVYVLDGTNLRTAPANNPAAVTAPVAITNVTAGETLVAIDVRPQNQQLYALGVNATTDTATLYCLSPQTGFAGVVGTASSIAYTTDGATPVDFPDPATVGWDIDFNPAVDRLRIVAGSLNCRVNPNNGTAVDGNNGGAAGSVTGTNPDGAINTGTTTVSATAYTNSKVQTSVAANAIATQYTLDPASNSLFIQTPPNAGTQVLAAAVTLGGNALDFSTLVGFDIPPGVDASASNTAVTAGFGFALLNVGGTTSLYSIDLVTGVATLFGPLSGRSLAIRREGGAALAMSADGQNLIRFETNTPGTTLTQAIAVASLVAGEQIVGIDFRPQTGQFYALAVNATTDTGSLYLLDPLSGALSLAAAGTASAITFAGEDFPDPATTGYGIDFNPTVDRLRVVTGSGLNFRIHPGTGLPATAVTDADINGTGVTGVSATAYTNSFAQSLTGGVTTQYTLDGVSNSLYIQNPPNNGTQTIPLPVTVGGAPLDFTDVNGFDIPASVRVSASNTVATGEGWAALTQSGITGLYRIDLTTGVATSLGGIGAGTTALAGLTVFTTPGLKVQDSANATLADNQDTIDFGDVGLPGEIQGDLIDNDHDGLVDEIEIAALTITNTGSQPLTYSATTVTTVFSVISNPSGVVAPGGSVQVEVSVAPNAPGAFNDTLTITTNDAAISSFRVALTADALLVVADDTAVVTTGETRINPLANDGLDSGFTIIAVSDPAITIAADGRTLIIPANFGAGSFIYTASDGTDQAKGAVTVTAGTPVVAPTAYSGLLFTAAGDIIGSANVTLSAKGVATVQILGGAGKASTKITVATVPSSGANFTSLGYITLDRNVDGTLDVFLAALGGNIGGTLLPVQKAATAAKHHIALASLELPITGGGYAIATVSAKGLVKITGVLIDGVPFSAASALRDNNTFAFYAATKGPKPPGTIGGELTVANLAKTDVSGTLRFAKQPQLLGVKGLYLNGVNTILAANGCLYDGTDPLPTGNGTLKLTGGNLAADEANPVIVSTAGIPAPAVGSALKTWTGVKIKVGKFSATVAVPGITKPVKGSGLYLPKTNSAWGFFPGTTVGGRIELTVP